MIINGASLTYHNYLKHCNAAICVCSRLHIKTQHYVTYIYLRTPFVLEIRAAAGTRVPVGYPGNKLPG